MMTGILVIASITLLGILSYRNRWLENRVYKQIPLIDWVLLIILPIGLFLGWILLVRSIIDRPAIPILPLDDFDNLLVTILFFSYGFVGIGIHFAAKVLWRYLKKDKDMMAFKINEIFHDKLSHYLAFLNALFIIFMLVLLEINHPLPFFSPLGLQVIIAFAGVLAAVSSCKTIFLLNEWSDGYNRTLFSITFILLGLILNLIRVLRLNYDYYPVMLFIISFLGGSLTTFVVRQVLIFTKLSKRRRLKFLARIFSAK